MKRYLFTCTFKIGPYSSETDSPKEAKKSFNQALAQGRTPCKVLDRNLGVVVLESTMPPKYLAAMLERFR